MAQNLQVKNEPIKEVQIKPEFLCNINSSRRKTVKAKRSNNPNLKPNNLKKTLLEKIRQHRLNSVTQSSNSINSNQNENNILPIKVPEKSIVKSPNIVSRQSENSELLEKVMESCKFFENLPKGKQRNKAPGGNIQVDTSNLPSIGTGSSIEIPDTNSREKMDIHVENDDMNGGSDKTDPPYSCMKNGSKPTYREWKRTKKNNQEMKDRKFILGKNGRKVSILVKNSDTRKMISTEHLRLKQVKVASMKNYLKKHNLLKSGSYAPNEMIKKMYEQSLLTGEVNNSNNVNIVENYLVN